MSDWRQEVYYEQTESRGISTKDFSLWKRLNGTGQSEFYDLSKDPQQKINQYNNPHYSKVVQELDLKLTEFFKKYSDPKYDLWNGGTVKGYDIGDRVMLWKKLYGNNWHPSVEVLPKFKEVMVK
jgi:hypothetical protein